MLHQQGFEVFLDQVVLAGGDELIKVLEDGLTQSQAGRAGMVACDTGLRLGSP